MGSAAGIRVYRSLARARTPSRIQAQRLQLINQRVLAWSSGCPHVSHAMLAFVLIWNAASAGAVSSVASPTIAPNVSELALVLVALVLFVSDEEYRSLHLIIVRPVEKA